MANGKLIAGAVLILLNLAVLAPIATSMVEDAVDDNFETYPYDTACADADCTTAEEDWATSTSERTYYAWNLTNLDEVMAGGEASYEKLGPFEYDITYTRNIIDFDKEAGTLTYDESKVFTCSETSPNDCNTMITQLNIPFQPQVVGATGLTIANVMTATKAGFTMGMLAKDVESMYAGAPTAAAMTQNLAAASTALQQALPLGPGYDSETADAAAPAVVADNFWAGYAANFEAVAGATYNQANGLHVDFAANFSDMNYAFYNAMGPGGEDLSLTGALGATMLSGHCSSFPTEDSATILADAPNGFVNSGTMTRANLWQFTAMADATTPDLEMTIARDWAMCAGVGMTFQTLGGGDSDWMVDQTGTAVNASTRLGHLGITMDNAEAMVLLFGDGDDVITGLLESEGSTFGVANFLTMDAPSAMAAYGIDQATYVALLTWAGNWMTDVSSLPMILLGGSGDLTASSFANISFGNEDPLQGGYLENSLNLGGAWGTALIPASDGAPSIALDAAVSGNILYGPLGLTTSNGAGFFLFGELMGVTPPLNMSNTPPTLEEGGVQMPWNTSTVATLYGVDENAANAIRTLMMNVIYGDLVPNTVLVDTFQSQGQYMTMPLNNWLYGWFDPVSMMVAEDPTAPSAGWAKLETNQSYYGSISEAHPNGISTGPASVYVMCTGHNPDCEKGEAVSEDGSEYLSWRNMEMMNATYGLVTPQSLAGTTGGFITGSGDLVDAGGYAVTDIVCDGTGELKGIPVDECSASVDPTGNPITAKLIKQFGLLDAMTPALPVYFGAEISMQSEQLSGLIIAGASTSTFYLDNRTGTDLASTPTMDDLQPVFQIVQGSEIEDGDAEEMESAIVQNQEFMGWWMNFDNGFDYVGLLLYLGGFALIAMHFFMSGNKDEESIE